jgi:hypothetical protein
VYKQILISKITNSEGEVKKTELTGRFPTRRRMFALDCSAMEEDEKEEEEEGGGGEGGEEEELLLTFWQRSFRFNSNKSPN